MKWVWTVTVAVILASTVLFARVGQLPVALSRLDCVNQPSTRLLVNDTAEWTTYAYDASMLLNEDSDKQVYVVQVAPHSRLIICVG